MKAQALANISELNNVVSIEKAKSKTFVEELLEINKMKYNLGLVYFGVITILFTSLFL